MVMAVSAGNSPSKVYPIYTFECPIMVMISLKGGINLYSKVLDGSINIDPQLISGALIAFSTFLGEAFRIKNHIERMIFNDYEIFIMNVDDVIFYYMFIGNEDESLEKITLFINKIKRMAIWKRITNGIPEMSKRSEKQIDKLVNQYLLKR